MKKMNLDAFGSVTVIYDGKQHDVRDLTFGEYRSNVLPRIRSIRADSDKHNWLKDNIEQIDAAEVTGSAQEDTSDLRQNYIEQVDQVNERIERTMIEIVKCYLPEIDVESMGMSRINALYVFLLENAIGKNVEPGEADAPQN